MTRSDQPELKSFWPLFLMAAIYSLIAALAFHIGLSKWIGVGLAWIAGGSLCWIAVMRYFPPDDTPDAGVFVDDTLSSGDHTPRPISIREIPEFVVELSLIFAFAPFLLTLLLVIKIIRRPGW